MNNENMQTGTTCEHCGKPIQQKETFCTSCGKDFKSNEKTQNTSHNRFCSGCGNVLLGGEKYCVNCGKETGNIPTNMQAGNPIETPPEGKIEHHLALSILVMLLCCMPLGIVGLVFSILSITEKNNGRYKRAIRNGKIAYRFNLAAVIAGLISNAIFAFGSLLFG